MKNLYKFYKSVLPCLCLTLSVGSIYAFSIFTPDLLNIFNCSKTQILFAFTLSIFFLGMSAAFFGKLVEKNIKLSAIISTILFSFGLYLTHLSINTNNIFLYYLGLGVFCGLGEGIAYLCPVKNLLLWFKKSKFKSVVMSISILTFGLGSTFCIGLFKLMKVYVDINNIFLYFALIYGLIMSIGCISINKPLYCKKKIEENKNKKLVDLKSLVKDKTFLDHWFFMFFNITSGLILIGSCSLILKDANLSDRVIALVMMICGLANGFGRLMFPFFNDFLKDKAKIILVLVFANIIFTFPSIIEPLIIPLTLIVCNMTYGGGFATAPSILLQKYGQDKLSIIHGYLLSSWGIASIFAFVCTYLISCFSTSYLTIPIYVLILNVVYLIFRPKETLECCLLHVEAGNH